MTDRCQIFTATLPLFFCLHAYADDLKIEDPASAIVRADKPSFEVTRSRNKTVVIQPKEGIEVAFFERHGRRVMEITNANTTLKRLAAVVNYDANGEVLSVSIPEDQYSMTVSEPETNTKQLSTVKEEGKLALRSRLAATPQPAARTQVVLTQPGSGTDNKRYYVDEKGILHDESQPDPNGRSSLVTFQKLRGPEAKAIVDLLQREENFRRFNVDRARTTTHVTNGEVHEVKSFEQDRGRALLIADNVTLPPQMIRGITPKFEVIMPSQQINELETRPEAALAFARQVITNMKPNQMIEGSGMSGLVRQCTEPFQVIQAH